MAEPRRETAAAVDRLVAWTPAAVIALAATFALRKLEDFDTWYHLSAGRWIVENGRVPVTDVLSYTVPEHEWINLQWLYDVVLYLLHAVGGAPALVVAAAICFAGAIALMLRNARLGADPLTASLVCLWAVLIAEERFSIRPEMFSFVLLEVVLALLLTARRDDGRRLWLLPLLMIVWVNVHSLFVIGLVAIACALGGALVGAIPLVPAAWRRGSDPGPAVRRRLLGYGALAAAATIVNPFLVDGMLFPLETFTRIDGSSTVFQSIGEFRSPFGGGYVTFSIWAYQSLLFTGIVLAVLAGISTLVPRRGRASVAHGDEPGFDLASVAFFAVLAYLSVLARRNIGLFAFGAAPLVAHWLRLVWLRLAPHAIAGSRAAVSITAAATIGACAVLCALVATNRYYVASQVQREFGLGVFEVNFPIRAGEFAAEVGLPGKLYNDMTSGGYLGWRQPIEGGVFIDGRLEVYDAEFFSRYFSGTQDPNEWLRQADEFGVNTVVLFHRWWNRHNLIRYLDWSDAWRRVYADDVAVMFVRLRGNEAVIARAAEAFPRWRQEWRERLFAPASGWREPLGRALGAEAYANLALTLRDVDEGLAAYEHTLALDATIPRKEAELRFAIAYYRARKGELETARRHLEIAARLDPANERVAKLLEELTR